MRSRSPLLLLAAAAILLHAPRVGAQFLNNPAAVLPEPEKFSLLTNIGVRVTSLLIPVTYKLKDEYKNFSNPAQSVDRSKSGTATYQWDSQTLELGAQDVVVRTHSTLSIGAGRISSTKKELGGASDSGVVFFNMNSISGQAGPLVHGWSFSFGLISFTVKEVYAPFDILANVVSFGYGGALLLTNNLHVFGGAMLLNFSGNGIGADDASTGGFPEPVVLATKSSSLSVQSSQGAFAVGGIEYVMKNKLWLSVEAYAPEFTGASAMVRFLF